MIPQTRLSRAKGLRGNADDEYEMTKLKAALNKRRKLAPMARSDVDWTDSRSKATVGAKPVQPPLHGQIGHNTLKDVRGLGGACMSKSDLNKKVAVQQ